MNHPVKKFKPDSKENQRHNRLGKNEDLYSMFTHNGVSNANNDLANNVNNNKTVQGFIKQEVKMEVGCSVSEIYDQTFNHSKQEKNHFVKIFYAIIVFHILTIF